ncbi:general substrate transporter [Radiomyces spectabilis]|uniref:general substrate transporter n=1 Tax=Radiomyces spectabilis TaxID=64574 RepID=UPI0022200AF1|nr:general substrate transporter [Radiomyces spectabilis]KAI8384463.1 general substrate transporter [Radiomyces spectabilis]
MALQKSQDMGYPKYMVFCALVAAFSGFNVGWHISVPNMPQGYITKCPPEGAGNGALPNCFPMSDGTWGFTVGAFPLGGLVGGLASMNLNNWFSRRTCILISCGWFILGGVLSACAVNLYMYSVGRAFVGIGAGICGSSVAIYVSEISTITARGALGSLFEMYLNLGILFTQLFGLWLGNTPSWRVLWAIPTVLAAIQLAVILFFTVETPRRLCGDKKYDAACAALQKLRAGADVEEEFAHMLAARQRESEGHPRMNVFQVLFWKDKHVTWHAIIVMVLQAYNQVGGIGPMSVYSVGFLSNVLSNAPLATAISLTDAGVNCIATLISLIFMRVVGRKGFMLLSLGGTTLGCIFMVIGASVKDPANPTKLGPLVITACIVYTFSYSMGCGVIPWMIAPELLPMHALAAGSALGSGSNWLFNFIINTIWPYMDSGMGSYSFIVFVAINFIGFVFVLFCMPETTGKDLDDDSDDKKKHDTLESGAAGSSQSSTKEKAHENVEHLENAK